MTHQQILEKAIQKAIDGGWKQDLIWIHGNVKNPDKVFMNQLDITNTHIYWAYDEYISVPELIFNHDFAKALWGEELSDDFVMFPDGEDYGEVWLYHLQQMVLADDPIKYLGENI